MNIFFDIDDTLIDYDLVEKQDGYKDIPPLQGAVKFIQRQVEAGNKIYIISWYNKENPNRIKEKYQWCLRNLPMIPYQNISFIPAPGNKANEAKRILKTKSLSSQDMLIDDLPENKKAWEEAGGRAFLFDRKTMTWENFF